jgi:KDO2-lipid IV(A) lauroyltransferase
MDTLIIFSIIVKVCVLSNPKKYPCANPPSLSHDSRVNSVWKRLRYRIEWLSLLTASRAIPLVPRPILLFGMRVLARIAYFADSRGRTTAFQNLRAVFPKTEKSDADLRTIVRRSYQLFAQSMADLFWSRRLTKDNYENYVDYQFEDEEAIEKARETGAIWVTPHYSNFEWIAFCMGFKGYPFCIIAEDFKNPHLTGIFSESRERSGHTIIPQQRAMIRLLKHLKSGGHAAFLPDLTVKPGQAATLIDCFGLKTCVTLLHAMLAQRTGLPVIPGICIPRDDGTYLLKGFAPLKFAPNATYQEIAQQCWNIFEDVIRQDPAPWLWMYKHWRYRPKDADPASYPAYANKSTPFEKLLAKD